ncbi:MAG: tetratricopeptide repeat protein, partial [Saprospiraceae bacterium]|nr:tetratricopeptide repeat protein [Saprospiraceae bacterium]
MKQWKFSTNALEQAPENSYILIGIGDCLRKLKRFEQAIEYYKRVYELDSGNRFALLGLGDAFRGLHKRQEA